MLLEEDREEIGTMKPRFSNLDQNVTVSVILLILISALFLIWLIGKSHGNNCINSSPLAQQSDFPVLPTAVLHERRRITEADYNEIVNSNMLTYNEEETSKLSLEDICDSGNVTCLSDRRAIDNRVRNFLLVNRNSIMQQLLFKHYLLFGRENKRAFEL
ncbi:unnamed protein product [Bursaphelenchus xylophilus]|uniref:(pine wood nematode) hypothetical protein n=1 Tax=Bursaphelenchus xylophilus TaxID=6326 RepID=A0A1I7RXP4_BURXY|nr:unnamed protein product [Bursaphelenchus xylophilus]CAG9126632.1 unnamed protein product [Bursaphelenchus xylophilus]